jgi:thiol:disulfide interchange protein
MKLAPICRILALSLAFVVTAAAGGEGWETDLTKAFAMAKEQKKPLLVEFTGSDWCPPCKMMHKNVFSKEEFLTKAKEKYILVCIDIPKKDPELTKKNQPLLEQYKVQGVPAVILFDPNGKEFDRFIASQYASVETFLAHINGALDKMGMD